MNIRKVASLTPEVDRVWHAAVHPDFPLLAAACSDKTVRIYSLRTFAHLSTIEGGHKRSVRSVAWKPGADPECVLATASFDSTVGIWRGGGGEQKERRQGDVDDANEDDDEQDEDWRFAVVLDGHDSEVKSVAWSVGGSLLATCSRDKSVWVWEEMDEDNFETIAVLQDHSQDVKMVCWHPEGEILASASYDDTIRLYKEDIDDWMCYAVLTGHESTVWSISFENNGADSRLVSSSDDLTVRVWCKSADDEDNNNAAGAVTASEKGISGAPVSIIKSAHNGSENWTTQHVLPKRHDRAVYSTSWSHASGRIASVGGDGKLIVYEENKGHGEQDSSTKNNGAWSVIAELEGCHGVQEANSVSWSRRWDKEGAGPKDEVLITSGDDGSINIYEVVAP